MLVAAVKGSPVKQDDEWTESVLAMRGEFDNQRQTTNTTTIEVDIPGLGKLKGALMESIQAVVFAGIPYAKPPVANLRWRPPVEVEAWEGTLDATRSAAQCPQVFNSNEPIPQGLSAFMDEDCLTLDVVVPLTVLQGSSTVPVMSYFFGGSFTSGGTGLFGTLPLLVENNMLTGPFGSGGIFVICNYRLNVLGFLALQELMDEDPDQPTTGNYGFQDQRLATQWVKQYISAFNGDPSKIIIGGQSAGGISVDAHIGSIRTPSDLFAAAMSQSGAPTGQFSKLSQGLGYGETFKTRTGCNQTDSAEVLACVRAMPWNCTDYAELYQSVVSYQGTVGALTGDKYSWRPLLDGYEFPVDTTPLEVVQANNHSFRGPVMIGNTKDEGTMFAISLVSTLQQIQANLTAQLPWLDSANEWGEDFMKELETAEAIGNALGVATPLSNPTVKTALGTVEAYNFVSRYHELSDELKPYALWTVVADMAGDALLTCPTRQYADALVAAGNPVYEYWYTWEPTTWASEWMTEYAELGLMGSFHQADVYPFFGSMNSAQFNQGSMCGLVQCDDAVDVGARYPEPDDWDQLVNNFQGFVSNFMSGDWDPNTGPNKHSLNWPLLNNGGSRMGINVNLTLMEGLWVNPQCDFWNHIDKVDLYEILVNLGLSA